MSKVKVSKELNDFLNRFKKYYVSECDDWKFKLLYLHDKNKSYDIDNAVEYSKFMLDISVSELATILYNGWEVEKITYDKYNIPYRFTFKGLYDGVEYTCVTNFGYDTVSLIWVEHDGYLNSCVMTLNDALANLNSRKWITDKILKSQ